MSSGTESKTIQAMTHAGPFRHLAAIGTGGVVIGFTAAVFASGLLGMPARMDAMETKVEVVIDALLDLQCKAKFDEGLVPSQTACWRDVEDRLSGLRRSP